MRRLRSTRALATRTRRTGATLVEVAISATLLIAVLGGAAMVAKSGSDLEKVSSARSLTRARGTRALERVVQLLELAESSSISPSPATAFGTEVARYRALESVVDGAPSWGDFHQIGFEYEDGEVNDGIDQDGDGRIDEGMLVWTRNVGEDDELRVVLVHDISERGVGETLNGLDDDGDGVIDEAGFGMVLEGSVLTLTLCLEDVDGRGQPYSTEVTTTLLLRN